MRKDPTSPAPAPTTAAGEPATVRGEQTKRLIVSTALRMFRENGYEQTTMRAIAKEAGVSVGNAYYYFGSKDHLIEAFYEDMQDAHREHAAPVLAASTDFGERLRGTFQAGIDALGPYHEFAAKFFKSAAEPTSPLHPLSPESAPARGASIALFRDVLEGSDAKVDKELRGELPELLQLLYLGIILFWVHDLSPEQRKTRLLIDRLTPMIDRLVGLSRLRILRPMSRELLDLIAALKDD
ncbi:MAG TPA: TetR family transcriptional regulator [Micromonosporaceae bacterium]|jgi:AcrR family transcriptional regulator